MKSLHSRTILAEESPDMWLYEYDYEYSLTFCHQEDENIRMPNVLYLKVRYRDLGLDASPNFYYYNSYSLFGFFYIQK